MTEPAQAGGQRWSAASYAENARFVADLGAEILNWAAPKAGERVLDIGCGDGPLTLKLADAGCDVIGIDASADMVAAACALGLDARVMPGEAITFSGEFDLVFSNAALHWMPDAEAVCSGAFRALKPGGRFVGEFGGHMNVAAILTAMMAAAEKFGGDRAIAHPWYFPTPDEHAAKLEKAGFSVQRIELVPRPTPLPTGISGWLATFRRPFFDQFDGARRTEVFVYVTECLRPVLCDGWGNWSADYVRLRFEAVKP